MFLKYRTIRTFSAQGHSQWIGFICFCILKWFPVNFIKNSSEDYFSRLIVHTIKCPNKKAHHSYLEPKDVSLNCIFCPNNSPKPEYSSFTVINDKGNRSTHFRWWNQQMFDIFAGKISKMINNNNYYNNNNTFSFTCLVKQSKWLQL